MTSEPCERIIGAEKDVTALKEEMSRRREQIYELHSKMDQIKDTIMAEIKELRKENFDFREDLMNEFRSLDERFARKNTEAKVEEAIKLKNKIIGALVVVGFIGFGQLAYLVSQWLKIL